MKWLRLVWRLFWWIPDMCAEHGRTLDGLRVPRGQP